MSEIDKLLGKHEHKDWYNSQESQVASIESRVKEIELSFQNLLRMRAKNYQQFSEVVQATKETERMWRGLDNELFKDLTQSAQVFDRSLKFKLFWVKYKKEKQHSENEEPGLGQSLSLPKMKKHYQFSLFLNLDRNIMHAHVVK